MVTEIHERFFGKFKFTSLLECWLWTGAKNWDGYGMIMGRNPRRVWIASRLSYELFKFPIPKGLKVLHTCDTPACVNPCHLFIGSDLDNAEDRRSKGRPAGGTITQSRKTHCPQGHEYSEANTFVRSKGWRNCRQCGRDNLKRYYKRKKEAYDLQLNSQP